MVGLKRDCLIQDAAGLNIDNLKAKGSLQAGYCLQISTSIEERETGR